MRLICESCEHGYVGSRCPHCGCGDWLAYSAPTDAVACDTECYSDYWLCKLDGIGDFQLFPGYALDIAGLRKALSRHKIVTFNGLKYDMPMIALALTGATNEQLKAASDYIIQNNVQPWQFYRECNLTDPNEWLDHIDLIEVAPGQGSLKAYGGKMHAPKIQDLPIPIDASIRWCDRVLLREYCQNDLDTTRALYETFTTQIALRESMSAEYGVDLRSKSDAQVAEAVMKSLLPFKVERPSYPVGMEFCYRPPEWLKFITPTLQDLLRQVSTLAFNINESGGVSPHIEADMITWGDQQVRLGTDGKWHKRPKKYSGRGVPGYTFAIGGLHSNESNRSVHSDDEYVLLDSDVGSYYPSLILRTEIYPKQIGAQFTAIYRGWYDTRMMAKKKMTELKIEQKMLKKMLTDLPNVP